MRECGWPCDSLDDLLSGRTPTTEPRALARGGRRSRRGAQRGAVWFWLVLVTAGTACGDDASSTADDAGGGDAEEAGDEAEVPDGEDDGVGPEVGDDVPAPDADADEGDSAEVEGDGPGTDADADGDDDGEGGPTDEDGDTVPASEDCDDHDPLVIVGSTRECTSACGTGLEYCSAGSWIGCTAPTDCTCAPPGSTRVVDCGRCGIASQRCGSDGLWELPGTCLYEEECFAGEPGTETCGLCGTRSRICDATCHWLPWTSCSGEGECDPSAGAPYWTPDGCVDGAVHQVTCGADCHMAEVWPCSADCAIAPRIGGTLDDEVCVPGGPFLMGTDIPQHIQTDNVPVHTVTLTPYLIDVYKVTNARYRACVAAGVCVAPLGPYASSGCTYGLTPTSDWDAFPITNLTWEQATQFCAWDGGRVLPSEAQWEKAAKGPAPRQVPYTWGTDPNTTCAYARAYYCFLGARLEAVDARPESASYYGLHMMNQGVWEWTADWYDAGYYSTSPSLDPTGPSTGTLHVFRGTGYQGASTLPFPSIAARHSLTGWLPEDVRGFRCARRAY